MSHLIAWAEASREKKKKQTQTTQRPTEIYGKKSNRWQNTHCPKPHAFSFPPALQRSAFFPSYNTISISLIFPFLKNEPANILQWRLLTLLTGGKIKLLFLKTPASLLDRHRLQGDETAVSPSKPSSCKTRALKLRVWFYRLHCNVFAFPLLLMYTYIWKKKKRQN